MKLYLTLSTLRGIQQSPEPDWQWRALDNDPQFSLEGWESGRGAWVCLEVHLRCDQARTGSIILYPDRGAGCSEKDVITLHLVGGMARGLFYLGQDVQALRFDPQDQACNFSIDRLSMLWLSRLELLLRTGGSLLFRRRGELPRVFRKGFGLLRRHGVSHLKGALLAHYNRPSRRSQEAGYDSWRERNELPIAEGRGKELAENGVLISIVMPTYNTPAKFLVQAIQSVLRQTYPKWELCIADDRSTETHVKKILEEYSRKDSRIRYVVRSENGHISAATNSAIALSSADYIAFMDHDDLIHENALFEFASAISTSPDVDVWYSDEDKVDSEGNRCRPFFKPDWSAHLLYSQQYIGHMVCAKKSAVQDVGGCRKGYEGAQDYDLLLRLSDSGARFGHIPKILYHWREHENSTASSADSKPYAHHAGLKAARESMQTRYAALIDGCEEAIGVFTYRPVFSSTAIRPASLIIPTRDRVDLLKVCLDSLIEKTRRCSYEVIIIDNGSVEPRTADFLNSLVSKFSFVRVIRDDSDFNWSVLNNIGAKFAKNDVLVFLNNDVEVIDEDWLYWLSGYATLPDVGCVGGLLLYPDRTIQHAGVVVGMNGWADHVFKGGAPIHYSSPYVSPMLARNVLANTGACMAIDRNRFFEIGGFDEKFIVCGSDVEIGIRADALGYKNVYCPYSTMIHYESKTRDPSKVPARDFEMSAIKYEPYRTKSCDPYYSKNLCRESVIPRLGEWF